MTTARFTNGEPYLREARTLKQSLRSWKFKPDGQIKIAIPNKGELSAETVNLLRQEKIADIESMARTYVARFDDVLIIRVNASDVPNYVAEGMVDFGITGYDRVVESAAPLETLLRLGYGKCRVSLAGLDVPVSDSRYFEGYLEGKVVATSLPRLASCYLKDRKINAEVRYLKGAVEGSVMAGFATAIIDVVSSGKTLLENGLREISTVLVSEAVLVSKREPISKDPRPLLVPFNDMIDSDPFPGADDCDISSH